MTRIETLVPGHARKRNGQRRPVSRVVLSVEGILIKDEEAGISAAAAAGLI